MGQLPYWHSVELSAGSRPVLREKEIDVLVEDNVGLYQGKSKILKRQDGRIYLTSQRLIYIDNNDAASQSLSIELADVKYIEYSSKFLKSSPKIVIFFKMFMPNAQRTPQKAITDKTTTWICPICSFANLVSIGVNYSSQAALPNCETCGIKATYELIKSVVEEFNKNNKPVPINISKRKQIECPTCTFLNHPSLRNCEICGSNLPISSSSLNILDKQEIFDDRLKIVTESQDGLDESKLDFIKISFHKSGDKNFFVKFQEILEKFQWDKLVQNGNVNKSAVQINDQKVEDDASKLKNDTLSFGIYTIAQNENKQTVKNEQIINSSLDDLQTLLNKANEILELTESFQKLQDLEGNPLQKTVHTITQDAFRDSQKENQKKLYIKEVSRQISEFLINDGVLKQQGGIITLLDLYALYNRGRIGFNLISPDELYQSCLMFERLKLPLSLKTINNVLVVSTSEYGDLGKILNDIKHFILTFGDTEPRSPFKYSNILKISDFFNWNVNITEEFLKIAIDRGVLVIDQQIFGKHYYLNLFEDWQESFESMDGNEHETLIEEEQPALLEVQSYPAQIQHEESVTDIIDTTTKNSAIDFDFPTVPRQKIRESETEQKVSNTTRQLESLQF